MQKAHGANRAEEGGENNVHTPQWQQEGEQEATQRGKALTHERQRGPQILLLVTQQVIL